MSEHAQRTTNDVQRAAPERRLRHRLAPWQPALIVNTPHDECEREADAFADAVARGAPFDQPLRAAAFDGARYELRPDSPSRAAESRIREALRGTGQPLDAQTRAMLQPRFGFDLSRVRVHVGDSPRELGAVAYASGHHVVFAPGAYSPRTRAGQRLLAHELAHVAQQSRMARDEAARDLLFVQRYNCGDASVNATKDEKAGPSTKSLGTFESVFGELEQVIKMTEANLLLNYQARAAPTPADSPETFAALDKTAQAKQGGRAGAASARHEDDKALKDAHGLLDKTTAEGTAAAQQADADGGAQAQEKKPVDLATLVAQGVHFAEPEIAGDFEDEAARQNALIEAQANKARAEQAMTGFIAQGVDAANSLRALGLTLEAPLRAAAEETKAAVQAAARERRAELEKMFKDARKRVSGREAGAKKKLKGEYDAAVSAINKAYDESQRAVQTKYDETLKLTTDLDKTAEKTVRDVFAKGSRAFAKAGADVGAEAKKIAASKADWYDGWSVPEASWYEGDDYYKRRHDARVCAALKVGDSFAQSYTEQGESAADMAMKGVPDVVIEIGKQTKQTKDEMLLERDGGLGTLKKGKEQALQAAKASYDGAVDAIATAAQSTREGLQRHERLMTKDLDALAQGQLLSLDAKVATGLGALVAGVDEAAIGFDRSIAGMLVGMGDVQAPAADQLGDFLLAQHEAVETARTAAAEGIQGNLNDVIGYVRASIGPALERIAALQQEAEGKAKPMVEGFDRTASSSTKSAVDGLKGGATEHAKGAKDNETHALQAIADAYKKSSDYVDSIKANLPKAFEDKAKEFKDGPEGLMKALRGQLPDTQDIEKVIEEEATKAADAIKPAWREVVGFILDIVITVIVAVAIAALVASGVGFGLGLLLAAGIGALGGLAKAGVKHFVKDEPVTLKEVGKMMALGALDGMLQFAGGRFIKLKFGDAATITTKRALYETGVNFGQGMINDTTALAWDGKLTWSSFGTTALQNAWAGALNFGGQRAFGAWKPNATRSFEDALFKGWKGANKEAFNAAIKQKVKEGGVNIVTNFLSNKELTGKVLEGKLPTGDDLIKAGWQSAVQEVTTQGTNLGLRGKWFADKPESESQPAQSAHPEAHVAPPPRPPQAVDQAGPQTTVTPPAHAERPAEAAAPGAELQGPRPAQTGSEPAAPGKHSAEDNMKSGFDAIGKRWEGYKAKILGKGEQPAVQGQEQPQGQALPAQGQEQQQGQTKPPAAGKGDEGVAPVHAVDETAPAPTSAASPKPDPGIQEPASAAKSQEPAAPAAAPAAHDDTPPRKPAAPDEAATRPQSTVDDLPARPPLPQNEETAQPAKPAHAEPAGEAKPAAAKQAEEPEPASRALAGEEAGGAVSAPKSGQPTGAKGQPVPSQAEKGAAPGAKPPAMDESKAASATAKKAGEREAGGPLKELTGEGKHADALGKIETRLEQAGSTKDVLDVWMGMGNWAEHTRWMSHEMHSSAAKQKLAGARQEIFDAAVAHMAQKTGKTVEEVKKDLRVVGSTGVTSDIDVTPMGKNTIENVKAFEEGVKAALKDHGYTDAQADKWRDVFGMNVYIDPQFKRFALDPRSANPQEQAAAAKLDFQEYAQLQLQNREQLLSRPPKEGASKDAWAEFKDKSIAQAALVDAETKARVEKQLEQVDGMGKERDAKLLAKAQQAEPALAKMSPEEALNHMRTDPKGKELMKSAKTSLLSEELDALHQMQKKTGDHDEQLSIQQKAELQSQTLKVGALQEEAYHPSAVKSVVEGQQAGHQEKAMKGLPPDPLAPLTPKERMNAAMDSANMLDDHVGQASKALQAGLDPNTAVGPVAKYLARQTLETTQMGVPIGKDAKLLGDVSRLLRSKVGEEMPAPGVTMTKAEAAQIEAAAIKAGLMERGPDGVARVNSEKFLQQAQQFSDTLRVGVTAKRGLDDDTLSALRPDESHPWRQTAPSEPTETPNAPKRPISMPVPARSKSAPPPDAPTGASPASAASEIGGGQGVLKAKPRKELPEEANLPPGGISGRVPGFLRTMLKSRPEAEAHFQKWADQDPMREVALLYDHKTQTYTIVQGEAFTVSVKNFKDHTLVKHFHPGTDVTNRLPSAQDLLYVFQQSGIVSPKGSHIAYVDPHTGEFAESSFGYHPPGDDGQPQFWVKFNDEHGNTTVKTFKGYPWAAGSEFQNWRSQFEQAHPPSLPKSMLDQGEQKSGSSRPAALVPATLGSPAKKVIPVPMPASGVAPAQHTGLAQSAGSVKPVAQQPDPVQQPGRPTAAAAPPAAQKGVAPARPEPADAPQVPAMSKRIERMLDQDPALREKMSQLAADAEMHGRPLESEPLKKYLGQAKTPQELHERLDTLTEITADMKARGGNPKRAQVLQDQAQAAADVDTRVPDPGTAGVPKLKTDVRTSHDAGAQGGREQAARDGIAVLPWDNPQSHIGDYGKGIDDLGRTPDGKLVILEWKGEGSRLSGDQMSSEWVGRKIAELKLLGDPMADTLLAAAQKGELGGVVYHTQILKGKKTRGQLKTERMDMEPYDGAAIVASFNARLAQLKARAGVP